MFFVTLIKFLFNEWFRPVSSDLSNPHSAIEFQRMKDSIEAGRDIKAANDNEPPKA
jgi:hypothetical protein